MFLLSGREVSDVWMGPSFLEDPAFLSPHSMGRYLETLRRKGCAEATIQSYRRNLDFFYHGSAGG